MLMRLNFASFKSFSPFFYDTMLHIFNELQKHVHAALENSRTFQDSYDQYYFSSTFQALETALSVFQHFSRIPGPCTNPVLPLQYQTIIVNTQDCVNGVLQQNKTNEFQQQQNCVTVSKLKSVHAVLLRHWADMLTALNKADLCCTTSIQRLNHRVLRGNQQREMYASDMIFYALSTVKVISVKNSLTKSNFKNTKLTTHMCIHSVRHTLHTHIKHRHRQRHGHTHTHTHTSYANTHKLTHTHMPKYFR